MNGNKYYRDFSPGEIFPQMDYLVVFLLKEIFRLGHLNGSLGEVLPVSLHLSLETVTSNVHEASKQRSLEHLQRAASTILSVSGQ